MKEGAITLNLRKIPDVWLKFGSAIHQDFLEDYPDFFSGIAEIYTNLTPSEQDELYDIILELNKPDYHMGIKGKYWAKSGAEIGVAGRDRYKFFGEVLATIEKQKLSG